MCVYVFMYVFVSRLLAKWKPIQTWNLAHILPSTLSKNESFVFSKKSPWRPLGSKNCRVTWIFRKSPRLPCFNFFFFFWGKLWRSDNMISSLWLRLESNQFSSFIHFETKIFVLAFASFILIQRFEIIQNDMVFTYNNLSASVFVKQSKN